MSQKFEVSLPLQLAAPVERVFAFFADHENMASLFGAHAVALRPGEDHPGGVGSVRAIGSGLFRIEETVTRFEPLRAIDYVISRGGPVKNHLGQIRFHPDGQGTRVDYVIRFESRIPGTGGLIATGLRKLWAQHALPRLAALERG